MRENLIISSFILLTWNIFAQEVDQSMAETIAINLQKQGTVKSTSVQGIPLIQKTNTLSFEQEQNVLYVVEYNGGGLAVISGDRAAPPVLGYCENGNYDTIQMPPGLRYLLNRYAHEIAELRNDTSKEAKTVREKNNILWDDMLNSTTTTSSNSNIISPMLTSKWSQGNNDLPQQPKHFNRYCPPKCLAGCTAVAMAQILYYWNCRINPQESHSYYWKKGEKNLSVNFSETQYQWAKMNDLVADNYNSLLIYHAGISCDTNYGENGSSSLPGKARDGFVNFWSINSNADVQWRIWHLRTWKDDLKKELDKKRPILYSGGGFVLRNIEITGHSWVIDGYDRSDKFHCNWGWGGSHDGYFSLGGFVIYDENGKVDARFNELESAIFNVEPVQPTGVGTPQFNTSYITVYYDIEGEELEVAPAYGATRYEWTTDHGTIKSDGSNKATLYTAEDAHVKVRACNELCGDYSPYTGINVNIKDVPEIERKYSTGNTQEYYISHIPENIPVSWTLDNTADFTLIQTNGKYATLRSNNIEGTGTLKAHVQLQGFNDLYLETSINTTPWKLDVSGSLLCGQYTFAPTAVFPHTESFKWSVSEGVEILSETNDTTLRVDLTGERTDVWVQLEVVQNGKTYTTREDLHVTVIRNVDVQIVDRWEEDGKWKALLHAELDPGGRYGYYDWRIKGDRQSGGIIMPPFAFRIEACMPDYENPYEIWPELPFDTVGIIKRDTIGYILNSNSEPLPPLDDLPPMIPSFNPSYAVATYPAGREAEVTCTLITPCKSVAGKAVLAVHTHAPSYSASYNRTTRTIQVDRTDGGTTGGTKHEASGLAPYQLRLYDNFGPVSTLDFDPAAATVFMPLGDLPDGSYYVNVADDKGEVIVRQYISAY